MNNTNDYEVMNLGAGIDVWDFYDEDEFFESYDPE